MIRIYVLLLASLLSIWGLTSCENSDTDKVNSYNLEVNLSQNEITAINGIISIKVSIKEFDQLAYLVINKINDTNNISEKYIKSNLSPEYIFEYIIKKDDSSTFYFEFIAVDNNNQSSEISKLIVNKGIVNCTIASVFFDELVNQQMIIDIVSIDTENTIFNFYIE